MTHVVVTRALFVMVAALLTVALVFGLFVQWRNPSSTGTEDGVQATDTTPGEALYATHCGTCHTLDLTVEYVRAAPSVDAGVATLADFLRNHGSASEPDRAVIVAYIKEHALR